MELETIVSRTQDIALTVASPHAAEHDKNASFPAEGVEALAKAGLLGLLVPTSLGGLGQGPRALAESVRILAEVDASLAMVTLMHHLATACIATAPNAAHHAPTLKAIAKGEHLTTLAFSERGSRSHFWAPVSKAVRAGERVRVSALKSWVTSAGHADSMVASALAPDGKGPTDSNLYLVDAKAPGVSISGPWDGMGLRANASAPVALEAVELPSSALLTADGLGFKAMLEGVLPLFNLGSAAVALGLCRAATAATVQHLKTARFEHMGVSLGEALPNLRARASEMQLRSDTLAALLEDTVRAIEVPSASTMLRVLQVKAAAGDAAIEVTSLGMRACGGAAFSKHTSLERFFRDAHAGAVMAPTVDVLHDLMGKALLGLPLF